MHMQYYLFCERLYKPVESYRRTADSWCPPPDGYPTHCCYGDALGLERIHSSEAAAFAADGRRSFGSSKRGGKRERPPGAYLLQVYPERPVFQEQQTSEQREEEEEEEAAEGGRARGLKVDNPVFD